MKQILLTLTTATLLSSCHGKPTEDYVQVIPQPETVEIYDGVFQIAGAEFKTDADLGEAATRAISGFEKALTSASGAESGTSGTTIIFRKSSSLAPEEYSVNICKGNAVVKASSLNGVLYAIETLKQMLPVEIYTGSTGPAWAQTYYPPRR